MSPKEQPAESALTDNPPKSSERRRLLRGGLAAGPVLMTIASRPVLGQVACTASAAMSISMQTSIDHQCQVTSGLSPDAWKATATQWPSPYFGTSAAATSTSSVTPKSTTTNNALLQQQLAAAGGYATGTTSTSSGSASTAGSYGSPTLYHCSTTGLGGHVFHNSTMLEVIDIIGASGFNSLGRYIVAALLNARAGRTPMLSEAVVRNMWNDLISRGYYEPTAGVRWTATEIVAYIRTTIV